MILKQYGTSYESVESNFNSRALTEVGFRRDRVFSISAGEFENSYEMVEEMVLNAESEGEVHDDAEAALLNVLQTQLDEAVGKLGDGEVLLIQNREGADYPKTRDKKRNVVVNGENRLYFHWWVDPPLRVAVFRKVH